MTVAAIQKSGCLRAECKHKLPGSRFDLNPMQLGCSHLRQKLWCVDTSYVFQHALKLVVWLTCRTSQPNCSRLVKRIQIIVCVMNRPRFAHVATRITGPWKQIVVKVTAKSAWTTVKPGSRTSEGFTAIHWILSSESLRLRAQDFKCEGVPRSLLGP